MAEPTTQKYETIFETLQLANSETLDIDAGATLTASPHDWRDTLRSSLPRLPLGSDASAQFTIDSVLGRGGMGVVHLAFQAALGRHVALKTVHEDRSSRDAENALLQEARVMGLVEHPNVVPVHVIGQDENGRPLIVMKRIDGTAWNVYLDGKEEIDADDPLRVHLGVVTAICRAVSFAHSRGILHRDIKPENVMIGQFGEVYLLDWGLAVSLREDVAFVPHVKGENVVVGTPAYMAPEMTVGQGDKIGVHTDIFLIGAVLYHVLTGSPPNHGKSLFDVLACSYEGRPRAYPEDVPWELREICERAMAHNPEDRYATVDELREAVDAALGHRASYELAEQAARSASLLEGALASGESAEEVHRIFGETRFGFLSALQIWDANPQARDGLESCLLAMIDYELGEKNVKGARSLAAQLVGEHSEVTHRIAEVEAELEAHAAQLAKLAYDYDENVGIVGKRWVVAVMAAMFLAPVFIRPFLPARAVPEYLHFLTDDWQMLLSNMWGVAFLPVVAGGVWHTFKHYRHHKTSRIFAQALLVMYVLGYGGRLSTMWADVPLVFAVATECLIYTSVLAIMGLAVDRRLFPPAMVFLGTAIAVLLAPSVAVTVYCIGASAACVTFIFADHLRGRIPGMMGSWDDRFSAK